MEREDSEGAIKGGEGGVKEAERITRLRENLWA